MNGEPRSIAADAFAALGAEPTEWSNGPGVRYGMHTHPYRKVLYVVAGSITFHVGDGDIIMMPGDRLDLPAGTGHAATVGSGGVTCLEAAVP